MPKKVLIIDRQPDRQETIPNLTQYGFHTYVTRSKQKYINVVQDIKPDVIIIYSPQPDKENGALYQNIRRISQAPILVISVVTKPGIVENVLDQGADEYLIKPVSLKILAARLRALARRSHNGHVYENSAAGTGELINYTPAQTTAKT
ncbi:MAG: response regulator [Chloroflexota bacterium]|nr:response regulator [Chloroflexota bacterium]